LSTWTLEGAVNYQFTNEAPWVIGGYSYPFTYIDQTSATFNGNTYLWFTPTDQHDYNAVYIDVNIEQGDYTTADYAPNFYSNVSGGFVPFSVQFIDNSTNASTSQLWDFGDGTNSTSQNPTHQYNTSGDYSVTLKKYNSTNGNHSVTYTNYIIATQLVAPTANFTYVVTPGVNSNVVKFTDVSTNYPSSWSWDFGDGLHSTDANPTHSYQYSGTYTVVETVTNNIGSTTKTSTVTVGSTVNDCQFAYVTKYTNSDLVFATGIVNHTKTSITCTDTTTFASSVTPDGKKALVATRGYSDKLKVIDTSTNTISASITLPYDAPLDIAISPDSKYAYIAYSAGKISAINLTSNTVITSMSSINGVSFSSMVSATVSPDGKYVWFNDIGVDKCFILNAADMTISYIIPSLNDPSCVRISPDGTRAAITNSGNNTLLFIDTSTYKITNVVSYSFNQPYMLQWSPNGNYVWVTDYSGNDVKSINTATYTGYTTTSVSTHPMGIAIDKNGIAWVGCGDSGIIALVNTTNFTSAGSISYSGANPYTPGDFVQPWHAPYSDFTVHGDNDTAYFTDTSISFYPITAWSWNFGDGTTGTEQNPSHTYTNNGLTNNYYNVTLTTTNSAGSSSTIKYNVFTAPPSVSPVCNWVSSITAGIYPHTVTFADTSTGNPTQWAWDFGDGVTSTQQNPAHTFNAGMYTVSMTASNPYGSDSKIRYNYITVAKQTPIVTWDTPARMHTGDILSGTQLNAVASVQGTFSYNPAPGTTMNTVGNIVLSTTFTPTDTVNYNSVTKSVTVYVASGVNESMSSVDIKYDIGGNTAYFTAIPVGGYPNQWNWDFGDGNTSTASAPNHTYALQSYYPVKLTVTNNNNSVNTTETVYVASSHIDYEANLDKVFTPGMTPVTFIAGMVDVATSNIGGGGLVGNVLFFGTIIILGFGAMMIRQMGVDVPIVILLFGLSVVCKFFPNVGAANVLMYLFLGLGMASLVYRLASKPDY
jgi:YVTN family beta-propeller protein